ncbi:AAA domain-containing protein [Aspergillus tubingensis]|uniref:AAA domain-containing protein n=1 Tax=Aspergillus tubingensis TaxID=5068 RepID=UPI00157867DB|nr:AAA domain-containing protein [Aspergillus tubingensis]GFN11997.1 AAA domain-containing protein [Aspergillus tubingensis]
MENGDLRIKENNQDESQNILIAMARGSSAEALYFKGPRERWIRFCLPDGGFLPEKSTFSHGDTAVCFRIIDRDIASKLSFEIFATEEISKKKHELHPENVVHSARLEFSLHIDGKQPRCVQDFAFKKHFTVKATEGQSGVEYEHPCYIDVEFTTIGGVSYGVYHENVSRLNGPAKRVFEHLQLLTSRNNRELRTNAYEVVNNYLSKPKDQRLGPSSPEEDAKWLAKETAFKKYWDTIGELVVQDASIVAYTHNLAGTPIVRRNLGANRKKIVIIADEDGQALEPDVLMPLVSLDRPGDVLGTIRGGDRQQPPWQLQRLRSPGTTNSDTRWEDRYLIDFRHSQFPFTLVSEQHRMQPRLSKSPSAFTYYGKMTDDPIVQSISIDTKFLDALLDWIKTRVPDVNFKSGMELNGVNVMDGETVVNDRTRSRSNLANVTIFDVDPEHIDNTGRLAEALNVLSKGLPFLEER